MNTFESSPWSITHFLRHSSCCYLARNVKNASLLLSSIDSEDLLALGLLISSSDSLEVLKISDILDVKAIRTSAYSTT